MTFEQFEKLVDTAIENIPEEFREKLDNVGIYVQDWPTWHQFRKSKVGRGWLLGLYEGIPHTKRGHYGLGGTLPDKITVFRKPLMAISQSPEHLKQLVIQTVEHEIAHHFGMDEVTVRKAQGRHV